MSEATSTSFGIPGVVPDPTTAPAAPNIPLLTQLKRGVFGSFFIAQKDKFHGNKWRTLAGQVIRFLQMTAFIFPVHGTFPIYNSTTKPLATVAHAFTIAGWFSHMDSQSFSVLFYMSVAIGAALVCGMAWAAVCFMRNSFPVLWPLRIVAKIGQFCASVLYIPVLTMLLSAFNCQDRSVNPFWAQVGLNCWGSAYTAQAAIIALLTLAFILVCALFSLVFYDWHPLTTNLAGRVHGRVEFVFILIKTVLVILIEIFPESVNEWILQGAVLAAGLCWVGMYLYALPFVHHHMNLLNVAFGTALTFMAVCGLVAQGYPAWDGGVALYLGVPLAGLLGAKLASDRIMRLAVKPVMSLGSAYEVELNARLLLNSIVFGNPMGKGFPNIIAYATRAGAVLTKDKSESTAAASGLARAANFASKLGRGAPTLATRVMNEAATKARNALQRIKSSSTLLRPLGRDSRHMDDGAGNNGGTTHRSRHTRRDDASGFRRNSSMATLNMAMNDPRGTPGGGQGGGGDPSSSAIPIGRSFPPPMTELGARPPGAQSAPVGEVPESLRQLSDSLETEDDIDLRVRAVQKHLPREAVDALEQTYITGSTCFRNSAMLHLIWARFYSVFRPNQHLEASHMLQAQRDDAGFDVQYFVFATQKANEDSGGGGKGSMSALSRVSYEKHLADARRLVIRAMQRQVVYWSEMLEETPTLNRLHRISADLTRAMKNAEESFRQTLSFSPQSVIALRLMATYQMYVNCDNEKSQALLADADRIEEQQAKEAQEERGASLRVMQEVGHSESDNMAIITISALPDSLGIIRSVNAASIRMFGWSKWQMERRNVNMLVPEPFSEMHDLALQIYLQSGESTVVDRCRVVLGMHQSGHIFPMLMSVRETSLNEGVSPTFVAMIRPLQSEEQHILLDSDFNVRSATASSCDILGVEPAELASSPWNLADFCHDFLSKAEDLLGGRQCVLTIRKHIREEESDGSGIDTDGEIESDGTGSTLNLLGHARPRAKQSQVPRPKPKGQGFTFEQHRPNNVQTTIKVELQTVVPRSTGSIIYCMYWTPFNTNKRAPVLPAKSSTNLRESSQGAPSSSRPMMGCPVMRSTNQGQQPPSGVMNGKPPQGIPPMRPPVSEHRGTATAGHETVDTAGQKIVSFDGASPVPDSAADSDRSLQLADSDSLSEVDADRLGGLHAAPGGHVLGPVPRRAGTPPMKNRLSEGIFPRDSRSSRADSEGMASTDLPKGRNDLSLAENGFSSEANGYPVSIMQKQAFMATAGFSRSAPQADRSVGGSSRGSTSQRTLGRLRKMLSSSRQPLLRSLVWLRNVGMIGLVVAVAVAISFVMTLIKSFRQYHDNIDASRASAEISMFVSHLTYEANTLVLARENMLDWDNETDFAIRDDMFRCAQKFAVSHRELNAMASAGGAIAPEAYSAAIYNVTEFAPTFASNAVRQWSSMRSFYEVGVKVSTIFLELSRKPLSEISETSPQVLFLEGNAYEGQAIEIGFHSALFTWFAGSLEKEVEFRKTSAAVFGGVIAVIAGLLFVILLPTLAIVDKSTDDVARQLLALPKGHLVKLRARALARYRKIVASNDSDGDGDSDADGTDDGDRSQGELVDADDDLFFGSPSKRVDLSAQLPAAMADSTKRRVSFLDPAPAKADHTALPVTTAAATGPGNERSSVASGSGFCCGRRKPEPSPMNKTIRRRSRKSLKSLLSLSVRYLIPFATSLVYFIVVYKTSLDILNTSLITATVSVAANNRNVAFQQYLTNVRKTIYSYKVSQTELADIGEMARMLGEECLGMHELLAFGGETEIVKLEPASLMESKLSSIMSGSTLTEAEELLFGDACARMARPDFDYSDGTGRIFHFDYDECARLGTGELTRGLHEAFLDVMHQGDAFLARRLHSKVSPNGNGTGMTYSDEGKAVGEYNIRAVLNSKEFKDFEILFGKYVLPGLKRISFLYADSATGAVLSHTTFAIAFTFAFLAFFIFYTTGVYFFGTVALNADIQNQRFLLLLLPPALVSQSAALKKHIQQMTLQDGLLGEQR